MDQELSSSEKNIKKKPRIISDGDRIPPNAVEIESAVLGCMIMDRTAMITVIDILKPDSFYFPSHQVIFEIIQQMFIDSEPLDLLTLTVHLRKRGELEAAGGLKYISSLTSRVASTQNVETYARIVAEMHMKREIIRTSQIAIRNAYDETIDVFDLIQQTEENHFAITESYTGKQSKKVQQIAKTAIEEIESARHNTSGVTGIPSGIESVDRITAGFQNSDFIVIAARPAMGKTAFVLTLARNMAVENDIPVAVFSLEMSSTQLIKRLFSAESEISTEKFRKGTINDNDFVKLHASIGKLVTSPLYIDDTAALSIISFRAKARRMVMEFGIKMIIIDYLQLMNGANANGFSGTREQEISSISRNLKEIAKELNLPIIALSQLSRSVETRGGDKRPILSDIRESGAIEQDADLIGFLYRPEVYGLVQDEEGQPTLGAAELIIAKHRNGSTDTAHMRFIGKFTKFIDVESYANSSFENTMQPNMEFEKHEDELDF